MEPLITIITVSYNCIDTIERTIKSVLAQDYSNYRYIVVDGNSTDGTYDAINKYNESLYRFISEPDEGMYYAMNKGISFVNDGFILFLNGDDYFVDNNVLTRMSHYLTNDTTVVIGRIIYGNKKTEVINVFGIKSIYYDIFYPHQAMFIPKRLFDALGGYDTQYKISADFEWICRAQYNKYKVNWVDETVSAFALGGRSNSLQCAIDEYNISSKYMQLTDDKYIDDMMRKTVEKALTYFFRLMLLDDAYLDGFISYFHRCNVYKNDTVQIWGAGFWAQLFIELFHKCGIYVSCVFDSDCRKKAVCGVTVAAYSPECASKIFISTESYDYEIVDFLNGEKYKANTDFYSFHEFRNEMLKRFDLENEIYKDFVKQTGLNVMEVERGPSQ